MIQSKPAQLPKRQYKLSESKRTLIRELSNSNKRFDISEMISAKDLRTPSCSHITRNYCKGHERIFGKENIFKNLKNK